MKAKIRALVNEVLDAIIDPKLKELVKTKTFLTGGCFKSLYHNQPVNDYDFYFINQDAVNEFNKIINARLTQPISFTNKKILYMDFKYRSQFAISFNLNKTTKIQFITRYYGIPEKVVANFDFKHTQNYYMPAIDEFSINEEILTKKELIFNSGASHPINALKRMQKFIQQGWTINDENLMYIAETINNLNLKDDKVYKEQSAGMYLFRESKMRGYPSKIVIG